MILKCLNKGDPELITTSVRTHYVQYQCVRGLLKADMIRWYLFIWYCYISGLEFCQYILDRVSIQIRRPMINMTRTFLNNQATCG